MAIKRSRKLKQVIQSVSRLFTVPDMPTHLLAGVTSSNPEDLSVQPTGFRTLDRALEIGGIPHGRVTELIGPGAPPISGGVNSIAARIGAKVQRQQETVTIIDLSSTFDAWQAERCGLVAAHLLLVQPDTILAAVAALEQAGRRAGLVIVSLGNVSNLLASIEPDLLKTLLRRLYHITRRSTSAFLFTTTPSLADPFDPHNYPTGFPLSELADIRLWVQDESWSHKNGLATAYKTNLTVIKNRFGLVGKGADIRVKFDFGAQMT